MKIYVGNLPYSTTAEDLRKEFEAFGEVASADVIKDQYSDRSKGFGFVEMPTASEARAAIGGLNGNEISGRALNVSEAKPREDRNRGGGFRGNRGGGGQRY